MLFVFLATEVLLLPFFIVFGVIPYYIRGTDKFVVADLQTIPKGFEVCNLLIHKLLGGDAGFLCLLLDLKTVLVGAGQVKDVVALLPFEASDGVANDGSVASAEVPSAARIVYGGRNVKLLFIHTI